MRRRVASTVAATLASVGVVVMIAAASAYAGPVDPCAQGECDTITVTMTVSGSGDPTADPVVTVTQTVTPSPSGAASQPEAPSTTPAPIPTVAQTLPTGDPIIEPPSETATESEEAVQLPPARPTTEPSASGPAFTDPEPQTVPIEIRNASPEFDQVNLSRKLAAPAALLVLLALLGWLVFEGRLRRLAHAAAVRRAGPIPPHALGPGMPMAHGGMVPYPGYPVQPYAPQVVSYVPVPYPMPYPQPPYVYPGQEGQPPYVAPHQEHYAQGYVIERTVQEPIPGQHVGDGTAVYPIHGEQPEEDPRRRKPY
ncbi:hypothetical protein [Acrocarpospora catenulata]|uniref:hypothetical protein n=1 Tax=Acrocarpospora catenulata TaxID=2836182 RepID=UPI001BDA3F88|nr:hypothetical protein [Acrocarpospora catenulata]